MRENMIRSVLYIICGILSAAAFLFTWHHMPASWLFDTNDSCPHPLAQKPMRFSRNFTVVLFFIALALLLSEKATEISVFWSLSLFWFLTQAALADACYRLIPDQWSLAVAILGVLRLFWPRFLPTSPQAALAAQLMPLCFCAVLTLFFYALPRRFRGDPLMGLGDIKLLFALAVALPPELFIASLIRSSLLGGAAAAILLLSRRAERGVPFGTVLAFAVGWAVLLPQGLLL